MQKSWKAFIKTGDPSYPGHEWKPYNGIQLHMEIENDATVSIGDTTLDPVVKKSRTWTRTFFKISISDIGCS